MKRKRLSEKESLSLYVANKLRIGDISKQMQELPFGYISEKQIHGKTYSYLQWKEDGKVRSSYIKDSDLDEMREKMDQKRVLTKDLQVINKQNKAIEHRFTKPVCERTWNLFQEESGKKRSKTKDLIDKVTDMVMQMPVAQTVRQLAKVPEKEQEAEYDMQYSL